MYYFIVRVSSGCGEVKTGTVVEGRVRVRVRYPPNDSLGNGVTPIKHVGRQHFHPLTDSAKATALAKSLDSKKQGTRAKIPAF